MWLASLVTLVVGGLMAHESIRFYEARQTCERTQKENERLLLNPLCADPWQRMTHGPKQEEACRAAEEENRVGTMACAVKTMWLGGAPAQLWERVTGSYWLLFGILAPTSCAAVMMCFWSCGQRAARRQTAEMQRELVDTMKQIASAAAVAVPRPPEPRRDYMNALPPVPSCYDDPMWNHFLMHRGPPQQPLVMPPARERVEMLDL